MPQPEERDAAYLWDMLEAARESSEFVSGMRFLDYSRNRIVQAAVERKLEIIGEAAGRVSSSTKVAHPEIPWRGMIGLRNVLAHEYGEVKQERIWRVVVENVPKLIEALRPLVPPIPPAE